MEYYHLYKGHFEKEKFLELSKQIGISNKKLNKWFWDRKNKEDDFKYSKYKYPKILFRIKNAETGKDLTPTFEQMFRKTPLFKITKEGKD